MSNKNTDLKKILEDKALKINRDLKLVMELDSSVYMYMQPISKAEFKAYYMLLAKLYNMALSEGIYETMPRVSGDYFKDLCQASKKDSTAFFNACFRLCEIHKNGEKGWESAPWTAACNAGWIDEEMKDRVEQFLPFFIALCYLYPEEKGAIVAVCGMNRSLLTSSPFMEFQSSYQTLKTEENSGDQEPMSQPAQ